GLPPDDAVARHRRLAARRSPRLISERRSRCVNIVVRDTPVDGRNLDGKCRIGDLPTMNFRRFVVLRTTKCLVGVDDLDTSKDGGGNKMRNVLKLLVAPAILLTGCAADPDQTSAKVEALDADNGMSLNGMSLNGMSLNGMSLNGMSLNGIYLNGMSLNG